MQVPISKIVDVLELILFMPCLGTGKSVDRQHRLEGTSDIYMFGKVTVHAAISWLLVEG